jgi:hypothetical protein
MKIILTIVILVIVLSGTALYVAYGTVDPCGILKKEISMQVQKSGNKDEQGLYILFGGFVERAIDSMTPIQCAQKAYEMRAQGYKEAQSELQSTGTSNEPQVLLNDQAMEALINSYR